LDAFDDGMGRLLSSLTALDYADKGNAHLGGSAEGIGELLDIALAGLGRQQRPSFVAQPCPPRIACLFGSLGINGSIAPPELCLCIDHSSPPNAKVRHLR
jgi:hypothetical protein